MSFSLRDLDPTSSSSAFGGLVRQGIEKLPGGATTLGMVDRYNATRPPTTREGVTGRDLGQLGTTAPDPRRPVDQTAAGSPRSLLVVGGVILAVLAALLLVFRRR